MRYLSFLIAALLVIGWVISFLVYGTTGSIPTFPAKLTFNFKWISDKLGTMIRVIGFCTIVFILQSCTAHYIAQVPVAPVEVITPSPYFGAVWIGGEWIWSGGRHTWVGGHWARPRAGRTWQAGEWRHGPRGHYWVGGRWR